MSVPKVNLQSPPHPALPDIVQDTLQAGLIGFCTADHEGRVLRRDGALAQWAPAPGEYLFSHPVMECLRDAVFTLRARGGDLVLPGLGLPSANGDLKIDLRFVWMDKGGYLLVTSSQAAARAAFEAAAAQERRERHILEEQLRAQELHLVDQRRLMALFIATVPAAIAMLDRDLRYVAASRRWMADFGLSTEMTQSGAALAASLPGVSARWSQGLADCLAGTEAECPLDQLTGAHGRSEYVRWRFLPWEMSAALGAATPQSGVLLFCETITQSVEQAHKLEEQARRLRSANTDMKNVSLALSHDLQAPLRQMVKFAQLLDADAGAGLAGSGRDFLDEIHGAGARMQAMTAGLLRYLRIAGRQPALRRVSLADTVAAAAANLRSDIEAARARLTISDLPLVDGDAELLTLLFQNLLQNSLKYAGADAPVISLSASAGGGLWRIAYTDNGPGIAATGAAKAFDLFQRLDNRPGIAGTGVGLAICRWIAEVHNGSIALDPQAAGLRVMLALPIAHAKDQPKALSSAAAAAPAASHAP